MLLFFYIPYKNIIFACKFEKIINVLEKTVDKVLFFVLVIKINIYYIALIHFYLKYKNILIVAFKMQINNGNL